jgi:predicted nucleic acid-binding protein
MLTPKQVFVDTSAWVAVADHHDQRHDQAATFYLDLIQQGGTLVTSSRILADAYSHFQGNGGRDSASRFRSLVSRAQQQGLVHVVPINSEITRLAWDIFERHHTRLGSFEHCPSFVIAGRLGLQDVFTFEDDFHVIGFRVWPLRRSNGKNGDLH